MSHLPPTMPVSAVVIGELRSLRRACGMSAERLANRMTELGYPVQRSVVANLESGRRKEVSIDHMVAAAQALDIDPVSLLVRCRIAPCPTCKGAPPQGFTCNTCGGA